ncbi:hypothetical protein J6590_064330 [Homalodisca vitripennis]|nr:hypothetical protein J6590_064330 [Homalodisca vitripennis]
MFMFSPIQDVDREGGEIDKLSVMTPVHPKRRKWSVQTTFALTGATYPSSLDLDRSHLYSQPYPSSVMNILKELSPEAKEKRDMGTATSPLCRRFNRQTQYASISKVSSPGELISCSV